MKPEIVSLNVGLPQTVPYQHKEVLTAINKQPAAGPLQLSKLNFEGDGQADLKFHGGPEKAVCVYPIEHYPYWENALGRALDYGAFGENVTVSGLTETEVCIGDTFRLGEAIVQISQPRQPCFKLSVKYGEPNLPIQVQDTGFTGYYFRVLEEGTVSAGSELVPLKRHEAGLTVAYANQIMHHEKDNVEGMQALLALPELSVSWRNTFTKRVAGQHTDTKARLSGTAE